MTESVTW